MENNDLIAALKSQARLRVQPSGDESALSLLLNNAIKEINRLKGNKMELIDYINKHYKGNKRQFALDNGMKPQQLSPMIKNKKHHVIDGHLCIFKAKLKIS